MANAKVDVLALKQRLCALEKAALADLTVPIASEAYPRWYAKPEVFPYWINRVATVATEEGADDYGEEMAIYVYTVTSRLIVAHVTADYEGELSEVIDLYVAKVIEYVDEHEMLQSASYPTMMPYLRRVHFTDGIAYGVVPLSAAGVQQVGADFNWRCEFEKTVNQAYLG